MMSALLALVLAGVGAMIFRAFYLSARWHLAELMILLVLLSVPCGVVFQGVQREKHFRDPADYITAAALSFIFCMPIFIGGWWAVYSAQRLNEHRPLRRIALLFAGVLACYGVLGVPLSAFKLGEWVNGYAAIASFVTCGMACVFAPVIIVEHRCRKLANERYKRKRVVPGPQ